MFLWLVVFVSLAAAAAAAAWAVRLQRAEAARRAVRVSALAEAIDAPAAVAPSLAPPPADEASPWFDTIATADAPRRRVEPSTAAAASLFADEFPGNTRSAFGPALALGALVLIAAIAGVTMLAGGRAESGVAAAAATEAHDAAAPIELVSMLDRTEAGVVTISGLVRNPRTNPPVERLTAVVFFFDGQGGFLASARALVDFPRLAPGGDSPFVVTAPAPRGAARFRVSFRTGDGGVVPHVDRRGDR